MTLGEWVRFIIFWELPPCEHRWVQAGETGKLAVEYDKHYWCTICGVLRHDTGWGPVKSTYHFPTRRL